jgi:hypothetical protein
MIHLTNETVYLKTTTLTNKMIVELIDKHRIPLDKYVDSFDYDNWIQRKKPKIIQGNVKSQGKIEREVPQQQQSFDNVEEKEKTPEEILKKNISKIPGYVPYTPPNPNATIIDKRDESILGGLGISPGKGGKVPR